MKTSRIALGLAVGMALACASFTNDSLLAGTLPTEHRAKTTSVLNRLQLKSSHISRIVVDRTPDLPQSIQVQLDDELVTLQLQPHSVRADNYRLRKQIADGSIVEVQPGPVRTFRGFVVEHPNALVAGSVLEDGLHAHIRMPGGDSWWIQPLKPHDLTAHEHDHLVYRDKDAFTAGVCGSDDLQRGPDAPAGIGGVAGTTPGLFIAELACDADVQYFNDYGSVSAVEARINNVINTVNMQYEEEVQITHEITDILVRTAEPDPYSSSNSSVLLGQFRDEWLANQTGVQRDVAKLFTGREINGGTIGEAWVIAGICNDNAFCYSQSDFSSSFACVTDIAAHELGHLWGGVHCACSSPAYTMNPTILCINRFNPTLTIPNIIAYRNTRPCLEIAAPANDDCADAMIISDGVTMFSNVGATTDGPDEPAACNFFGDSQIVPDVWFRYTATCTGPVTVDLCGSSYDTKLAVYSADCPTGSNQVIACNDDFDCDGSGQTGDDGFVSRVVFDGALGEEYLIRIGGYNGATGDGMLTVSSAPGCIADLDCDGIVGQTDLGTLLASFNENDAADLTGDGFTDQADLGVLLAQFGEMTCD